MLLADKPVTDTPAKRAQKLHAVWRKLHMRHGEGDHRGCFDCRDLAEELIAIVQG